MLRRTDIRAETLREQAEDLDWGRAVGEPKDAAAALDYIAHAFGEMKHSASLDQVYAMKMVLWLQERATRSA
jgi:hypothetical protein